MNIYSEHEKLDKVKEQSQEFGLFLENLDLNYGYVLCQWDGKEYCRINTRIEHVLAEYFGIDYNKLMDEKDQMLEEIRNANR